MNKFSKISEERLKTCHSDLQRLFNEVVKHYDCTVICGHRGKDEQDEAVRTGNSKLKWPDSKHNQLLSLAIDVVPYPVDWADKARFMHFAGFVLGIAKSMGIKIRWGGDWSQDLNFKNDKFVDYPHFELTD
ncbi:MAG: M15 family metallopeptidase [Bdellovibrionaceae bacterium]|nr:M15 family metallopeptidase [Pseudobdellovibrionaceae bacterium]